MGMVLLAEGLNQAPVVQVPDSAAGQRGVDAQPFADCVRRNKLHLRHLRHELI